MEYYKLQLNCPSCNQPGELIEVHYSADGNIYIFGICDRCGRDDIVWVYAVEELIGSAAIMDKETCECQTFQEFLGNIIGKDITGFRKMR